LESEITPHCGYQKQKMKNPVVKADTLLAALTYPACAGSGYFSTGSFDKILSVEGGDAWKEINGTEVFPRESEWWYMAGGGKEFPCRQGCEVMLILTRRDQRRNDGREYN
jgi:hypothetical protein